MEALEDGGDPEDAVTALHRLRIESSSTLHPSPALLNTVMTRLLLDQEDPEVAAAALSYLHHFLFLHAHRGRDAARRDLWLTLLLSAFRELGEERQFRIFDRENQHDLAACRHMWHRLFQRLEGEQEEEEERGPSLLLAFLTTALQRDFEMWWKMSATSDSTFPSLYYMLGGRGEVLATTRDTVLPLYRVSLGRGGGGLGEVRRLLAMVALLLSRMDHRDKDSNLHTGTKVTLANLVASTLQSASLGDRVGAAILILISHPNFFLKELFIELSLLQPPWLGVLVCQGLLKNR